MQLTDNFTLSEFTKSQTAMRLNIDNTPTENDIRFMILLSMSVLEPVRKHFKIPFSLNSGFRCQELNKAIGSSSTSQHTKGQAADIEVPGVSNYDLAVWIAKYLMFDQIILEHYKVGYPHSGWVHVSLKQHGNRQEVLTFNNGRYLTGLMK